MIKQDGNRRETYDSGAQKLKASATAKQTPSFPDTGDEGDMPKKPYGLTEPLDETTEEVRTSEGVNPSGAEPMDSEFIDPKLQRERTL